MPIDPITGMVIATGINVAGNLGAQAYTSARNMKLAKYAWNNNLKMWDMQNEYNSPKAQMDRLIEAGLNPRLMYGGGSQVANVAKEMPKYEAPREQYNFPEVSIPGMLSTAADLKIKSAQADLVREEVEQRRLDNKLRSGTLKYDIERAMNEAGIKRDEASIKAIARSVEEALYHRGEGVGTDLDTAMSSAQYKGRVAELERTQAQANETFTRGQLRKIESEMYEGLKRAGVGVQVARTVVDSLLGFIK